MRAMSSRLLVLAALLTLPVAAGCDADPEAGIDPNAPTWHADVAPIVARNCETCHSAGQIGPFTLTSYEDAAPIAGWMAEMVEDGTMPPWSAVETDECTPPAGWKNDVRLSPEEIEMISAWADAGAPEGDAATAAPLPEPVSYAMDSFDQELTPRVPFIAEGTDDQYRCFVLDPELEQEAWMTGLQVVAGNPDVVHHVLVFAAPAADAANLDAMSGLSGSYDCFGGAGNISEPRLVATWAPGSFPFQAPAGTGIHFEAGSRMVAQIHYHPLGPAAAPDETKLQLQWTDTDPGREAIMLLLGNEGGAPNLMDGPNDPDSGPAFVIPAGEAAHTEEIVYTLPGNWPEIKVFAAGTHMHYVGVDMIIEIDRADGTEDCFVHTPRWDFNWQRWYEYDLPVDELPTLSGGDTLRLRCTYNNSLSNPFVAEALSEQGMDEPVDVYLGEGTLDEMCLGVFGLIL